MAKLTALRVARIARGSAKLPEHPNLETLIEGESEKVADGYHYARWIVPLVGVSLALACFLPLALTIHPLFWLGVAGVAAASGIVGWVCHLQARRISATQIRLRKACLALGNRMIGFNHLLGLTPTLSPKVAELLDQAARVYLESVASDEADHAAKGVWGEAATKVRRALEEGMAQMLKLAEPTTPQAQEAELARGWAQPLLAEMQATSRALAEHARAIGSAEASTASPMADLADARAHLERLGAAVRELEQESPPSVRQLH